MTAMSCDSVYRRAGALAASGCCADSRAQPKKHALCRWGTDGIACPGGRGLQTQDALPACPARQALVGLERAPNCCPSGGARTARAAPARARSAYHKTAQAAWEAPACCCARVRATTRRNTSLMTRPRTSPSGFCRPTIRPKRTPASTGSSTAAVASCSAARNKSSALASSSTRTQGALAVHRERPAAAPRLPRTFCRKSFRHKASGAGKLSRRLSGSATCRCGGRRSAPWATR